MRPAGFLQGSTFLVLASLASPEALAQQALCPASPLLSNGVRAVEVSLQQGLCTNSGTPSARIPAALGGFPTGAFSGAALATQALTELTQATSREATRGLQDNLRNRRDEERDLCAAGFTLVGGSCETGRSVAADASLEGIGRYPRAATIRAGSADAASARFASWVALYGDYERRSVEGSAQFSVGAWGGGTTSLDLPVSVRTRAGSVGFAFGGDATIRGVIAPDDGLIAGLSIGYLTSDVTIATSSGPSRDPVFPPAMGQASSLTRVGSAGATIAAYAVYFDGGFSTDLLLKADLLALDESFNDVFSFTHPGEGQPPLSSSFSGAGRFGLANITLAGNIDYRFIVRPDLWIEPTVGAQYTHSTYGNGAAAFGLDDADLVMVQGGARVGLPILLDSRVLVTTTLTGLAYSDVLVRGGFVPGAAFLAGDLLAQADEGQVRGRGVVAVDVDFGNGVSSFIQGEARGGKGLFGAGGRAGLRIVW